MEVSDRDRELAELFNSKISAYHAGDGWLDIDSTTELIAAHVASETAAKDARIKELEVSRDSIFADFLTIHADFMRVCEERRDAALMVQTLKESMSRIRSEATVHILACDIAALEAKEGK